MNRQTTRLNNFRNKRVFVIAAYAFGIGVAAHQSGQAQSALPDQSVPQEQLKQEDSQLAKIPAPPPPWQSSGQPAAQQAGQVSSQANQSLSHEGGQNPGQLPVGTKTPLPGGGPKNGAGPIGPGGTSEVAQDSNAGPNRYKNRPPSWENLNEIDAGRNQNAPGSPNTSVASGANIFGTTPVPFAVGPGASSPVEQAGEAHSNDQTSP